MDDQNRLRLDRIAARYARRPSGPGPRSAPDGGAAEVSFLTSFQRVRDRVLRPVMEEVGLSLKTAGYSFRIGPGGTEEAPAVDFHIALPDRGESRDIIRFLAHKDELLGWQVVAELELKRSPIELTRFETCEEITAEVAEHLIIDAVEQIFASATTAAAVEASPVQVAAPVQPPESPNDRSRFDCAPTIAGAKDIAIEPLGSGPARDAVSESYTPARVETEEVDVRIFRDALPFMRGRAQPVRVEDAPLAGADDEGSCDETLTLSVVDLMELDESPTDEPSGPSDSGDRTLPPRSNSVRPPELPFTHTSSPEPSPPADVRGPPLRIEATARHLGAADRNTPGSQGVAVEVIAIHTVRPPPPTIEPPRVAAPPAALAPRERGLSQVDRERAATPPSATSVPAPLVDFRTSIEAFASLRVRFDDPFGHGSELVAMLGLDRGAYEELCRDWRARMASDPSGEMTRRFATAYREALALRRAGSPGQAHADHVAEAAKAPRPSTPSAASGQTHVVTFEGPAPHADAPQMTGAAAGDSDDVAATAATLNAFQLPSAFLAGALPFRRGPAVPAFAKASVQLPERPADALGGTMPVLEPVRTTVLPFAGQGANPPAPPSATSLYGSQHRDESVSDAQPPKKRLMRFDPQTGKPLPHPVWAQLPEQGDRPAGDSASGVEPPKK